MFCTNCGTQLTPKANFCGNCGNPISTSGSGSANLKASTQPEVGPDIVPWQESADFKTVLNHPDVHKMIDDASKIHGKAMSADDFLKAAKPLLSAVGAGSVPLGLIMEIAPGIYSKMGINTGKIRTHTFQASIGRVIAAAMCSMASRHQLLIEGISAEDGCVLKSKIPSSMFVFGGELALTISTCSNETQVKIATQIPGQMFDWGTSTKIIENLISDIPRFLGRQSN